MKVTSLITTIIWAIREGHVCKYVHLAMNLPLGLVGTLHLWVMVVGAFSRGFLTPSPQSKLANSAEKYFVVFQPHLLLQH